MLGTKRLDIMKSKRLPLQSEPRSRGSTLIRVTTLGTVSALLMACVHPPRGVHRAGPQPVRTEVVSTAPQPALYFYPERGQNEAVQDRDRYECYRWSVQQTGIEPSMTPVRIAVPAEPVRHGRAVAAGAATGAVAGGVIAAGTGSSSSAAGGIVLGAILGAAVSSAAQASRAQQLEQVRQSRIAQAEQLSEQQHANFSRAMSACMSARAYSVR